MKIGDTVYIRGTIDEIRKDVVIIKNKGGYFGTVPEEIVPQSDREFIEVMVKYPPPEICTYPEYRGKPYYSILYKENGEEVVGFGTYKPEVLSEYIRNYFITVPEEIQTDIGDHIDIGDFSKELWLSSRNRAFDEVLEIVAKIIEGQIKQAERFNGDGCRELAKIHQDQAYGAQMVKQAVLRLKEGEE